MWGEFILPNAIITFNLMYINLCIARLSPNQMYVTSISIHAVTTYVQ